MSSRLRVVRFFLVQEELSLPPIGPLLPLPASPEGELIELEKVADAVTALLADGSTIRFPPVGPVVSSLILP